MDADLENQHDAFLLDTLEHVEDDAAVLQHVANSVREYGNIYVTVPAFNALWTTNDDQAGHLRRYTKRDLRELATETGLKLVWSGYFMTALTPVMWLTRKLRPRPIEQTHRIPPRIVNTLLSWFLNAEGWVASTGVMPFGSSLCGVFEK